MQPGEHAGLWGTAGRAPPRGTIRDDSQLLPRHLPGFGRTSDPPDCDSRIPDCRSSWGDYRSRWRAWAGSWKSTRPFLVEGASPCRPGPWCGGYCPPHRGPTPPAAACTEGLLRTYGMAASGVPLETVPGAILECLWGPGDLPKDTFGGQEISQRILLGAGRPPKGWFTTGTPS